MIRDTVLKIRLSQNERSVIDKRAGRMSAAAYLRECAINRAPTAIPEINQKTLLELSRIGNNLNQIARRANAGFQIDHIELRQQIAALRLSLIESRK